MSASLEEFLDRFNDLVAPDDAQGRATGCVVLVGCLEEAIHDAAEGNTAAMGDARFCAEALIALKAETVLSKDYFEDYMRVAKLLVTAGEVQDTPLAFEDLDDLLSYRIPPLPALH